MSQPTCASCQFFVTQVDDATLPYWTTESKCHRYPPSRYAFKVIGSDWCGEHKPKSRVTENLT
jgi:hypothetical protein